MVLYKIPYKRIPCTGFIQRIRSIDSLDKKNSWRACRTILDNEKERTRILLAIQQEAENNSITSMRISDDEKFKLRQTLNKKYDILRKQNDANEKLSQDQQLSMASNTAGNLSNILGQQTEAGKAMAIVQTTIDTYKGDQSAYASFKQLPPPLGPILGGVAAAATIAMGLRNIAAIKAASPEGALSSAQQQTNISARAGASAQTPSPEMLSGAFTLGGGLAPEPARAYVVSDDITNNQNKLAIIRRRATI